MLNIISGEAELAVESAGSGEPIIFIHAGVADRRMWGPQVEAFSSSYHVISYDQRGFGETTTPDEAFSFAGDLAAIIEHFQLDQVTLTVTLIG